MSVIDKFIAAVTPPESDEARLEAREEANEAAEPGDWLSQILEHHLDIEDAFDAVKAAQNPAERLSEFRQLAVLLNGHSIAEEAVIYPALATSGEKGHAGVGYDEQAMVKVQMAALEALNPMSQDFLDKLEHIEGAVAHHVYAEEGNWFLDLKKKADPAEQAKLSSRYTEEYARYARDDALG